MKLFQHQEIAATRICEYLGSGERGFLLADQMGVGKTFIALAVMQRMNTRCLVIAPASLVSMWRSYINEYNLPATCASYEYFRRHPEVAEGCELVVLDEAHKVRNPRTEVAKQVRGIARGRALLLLTGTPLQNGPEELAHLVYLAGGDHRYILNFSTRVPTPWGTKVVWRRGSIAVVGEWLRSQPWYLRRELAEVSQYMPKLTRRAVVLDENSTYHRAAAEIRSELLCRAAEAGSKKAETLRALADNIIAESADVEEVMPYLSSARRLIAKAKVDDVARYVKDISEDGGQVIIFMHHREAIDTLATALKCPALVGGLSHDEKHKIVREFNAGVHKFLICGLRVAGEGLNLNTAHVAVFAEFDWNPAVNQQAEARIRRITDILPKQVHYILAPNIIDTVVLRVARAKERKAQEVLSSQPETPAHQYTQNYSLAVN